MNTEFNEISQYQLKKEDLKLLQENITKKGLKDYCAYKKLRLERDPVIMAKIKEIITDEFSLYYAKIKNYMKNHLKPSKSLISYEHVYSALEVSEQAIIEITKDKHYKNFSKILPYTVVKKIFNRGNLYLTKQKSEKNNLNSFEVLKCAIILFTMNYIKALENIVVNLCKRRTITLERVEAAANTLSK